MQRLGELSETGGQGVLCENAQDITSVSAFQGFEYQTSGPSKEPIRAIRTWLKENVQVFLEKLENEVCKLEQLVRDLVEWLDVLLGEAQPQGPCCTLGNHS